MTDAKKPPECRICRIEADPDFDKRKQDTRAHAAASGYIAGFCESRFIGENVAHSLCGKHAGALLVYSKLMSAITVETVLGGNAKEAADRAIATVREQLGGGEIFEGEEPVLDTEGEEVSPPEVNTKADKAVN